MEAIHRKGDRQFNGEGNRKDHPYDFDLRGIDEFLRGGTGGSPVRCLIGSRVSDSPSWLPLVSESRFLSGTQYLQAVEERDLSEATQRKGDRPHAGRGKRRFQNNDLALRDIAEPLRAGPEGRRCKASFKRGTRWPQMPA
jgi:hypothetical protein